MKKVIITGASSGIGLELAKIFTNKNYQIINISRHECPIKSVINIKTDYKDIDNLKATCKIIQEEHNDASILINCVGMMYKKLIGEFTPQEISDQIQINLTGTVILNDSLSQIIKKNKGDIIMIGSTSSFYAYPGSSIYTLNKYGLRGYVDALQTELKQYDVRVIGVYPGGINTPFHKKANTDFNTQTLMPVEDIAKLINHLIDLPRIMEVSQIIINRNRFYSK